MPRQRLQAPRLSDKNGLMQGYSTADASALQSWKIPHMLKGALTWVPPLNAWRRHRATTGGSDSARYCYSVWLRHLRSLAPYGFRVKGAHVGELGPGDSIGIGLAALLSGAVGPRCHAVFSKSESARDFR